MNCKPGDLAVIVGTQSHPECNGMIVEVLAPAKPGFWYVRGRALEAYAKAHGYFSSGRPDSVRDDKLRPISGGGLHDEVQDIHPAAVLETVKG